MESEQLKSTISSFFYENDEVSKRMKSHMEGFVDKKIKELYTMQMEKLQESFEQHGIQKTLTMRWMIPLFEKLSHDEQIELFVNAFVVIHTSENSNHFKTVSLVTNFKYLLHHYPHLFMQVVDDERIREMYDQYLLDVVPKPSEHIPTVTKDEYKKWYMKIFIAAIQCDMPLIEMVDKDILHDKEFVMMADREIDFGSADMLVWETEYDTDVQNFVKNVKALRNLRMTNHKGTRGILHGTMRVLPLGKVEEFLGLV